MKRLLQRLDRRFVSWGAASAAHVLLALALTAWRADPLPPSGRTIAVDLVRAAPATVVAPPVAPEPAPAPEPDPPPEPVVVVPPAPAETPPPEAIEAPAPPAEPPVVEEAPRAAARPPDRPGDVVPEPVPLDAPVATVRPRGDAGPIPPPPAPAVEAPDAERSAAAVILERYRAEVMENAPELPRAPREALANLLTCMEEALETGQSCEDVLGVASRENLLVALPADPFAAHVTTGRLFFDPSRNVLIDQRGRIVSASPYALARDRDPRAVVGEDGLLEPGVLDPVFGD